MDDVLKVTQNGQILEVTLDRPKANAIDATTSRRMGTLFGEFRDDPTLRVAIITGGGEKFFSAGWDLNAAAGHWGLVNAVTTRDGLMDKAREYTQAIIKAAPLAIAAVKEVARATEALGAPACYALMRSGQLKAYQRMLGSEDAKEGPRAFTEKRQPVWQGR